MNPKRPRSGKAGPDYQGYFAPTRREILRWMAYGSAGVALGGGLLSCSNDDERGGGTTTTAPDPGTLNPNRILIVLELGGGNDALSTLVPYENSTYQRLRPTLALGGDEVIDWGSGLGLNKRLASLDDQGLAIVNGIGTTTPDLSHFDMLDRWWNGSTAALTPEQKAALNPGFIGRLCDEIQGDERFTGMSLKFGSAAGLRAAKAATTGLPPANGSFLADDELNGKALGRFLQETSAGSRDDQIGAARVGVERMLWIVDLIQQLPAPPTGYPDTDFGLQMAIASSLVRSAAGVRVLHIPMGISEYDTHAQHGVVHPALMTELNDGLSAFVSDMRAHKMDDRVLIATTSEFGRRVEEHSEGLDHGAAGLMMMMGPVKAGMHGEPSEVEKVDELGNLIATMTFDRYLATMAAWLEVDPGAVLQVGADGKVPQPIDGLLTV